MPLTKPYDQQNPWHHEPGLQARAAMQFPPSPAGRQSHELGEPTNHERLPADSHDAEAGVRGSSQYSRAKAHVTLSDAATALRVSELLGLMWMDLDFEGLVIYVRRAYVWGRFKEPKSKASKAPVPMHPLLAGFLLAWHERTKYAKESDYVFPSVKLRGKKPLSASIMALAPRSHKRRRDSFELEGTLRFSQLSPFTGDGTCEAESGPQNRAGCSAARGLWHNDGTLCTVRHGLHEGCARQVPGTAHGRQNSPAHRASSVRIMGWIVGWEFSLFATKVFGMWWPGTELNRRRQPFQNSYFQCFQQLQGLPRDC